VCEQSYRGFESPPSVLLPRGEGSGPRSDSCWPGWASAAGRLVGAGQAHEEGRNIPVVDGPILVGVASQAAIGVADAGAGQASLEPPEILLIDVPVAVEVGEGNDLQICGELEAVASATLMTAE
jgi:hypothetical protein